MDEKSASEQIDDIITLYGGWKGKTLAELRALIRQADPAITEEIKWRMRTRPEGLPVWTHEGIVCLVETFKNDMKLVFFKGASLKDPAKLFNARLQSGSERAIEFREGDRVKDEAALKQLVVQAVEFNQAKKK